MRPREIILAAIYVGAIGGYAVAKSGLDKKLVAIVETSVDRRAIRNAHLLMDVAESRAAIVLRPEALDRQKTVKEASHGTEG